MSYVLQAISGLGALLILAILIKAFASRRKIIAESPFPAYARASINLSHLVSLCVLIPWVFATLHAGHFGLWLLWMLAPIPLAGVIALPIANRIQKKQPLEATAYFQDQQGQSPLGRFQTRIVEKHEDRPRFR